MRGHFHPVAWLSDVVRLLVMGLLLASFQGVPTAAFAQTDYQLTPGDVIEFDFLDDEQEPRQLTIANDGRVQAPLLGGVEIAGLTISQAVEKLSKMYVDQQYLNDPKIAISITNFRPIFVLGDVRSPGSFPFQPHLTVEQAVGLAGGPDLAMTNNSDRILTRERLRGNIAEIDADIARQAVWAARLTAQLDGRSTISTSDIPEVAQPYVTAGGLVERLMQGEEKILVADNQAFESQRTHLTGAIAESEQEAALLNQLLENQRTTIKYGQQELERYRTLLERGLKTESEVVALERQASVERGRILQISADISRARRGIGDLNSQLADLENSRRQQALLELQNRKAEIEKLVSRRQSTLDQFALVGSPTSSGDESVTISYNIRRATIGGEFTDHPATTISPLSPGDVLVVKVEMPVEAQRVVQ